MTKSLWHIVTLLTWLHLHMFLISANIRFHSFIHVTVEDPGCGRVHIHRFVQPSSKAEATPSFHQGEFIVPLTIKPNSSVKWCGRYTRRISGKSRNVSLWGRRNLDTSRPPKIPGSAAIIKGLRHSCHCIFRYLSYLWPVCAAEWILLPPLCERVCLCSFPGVGKLDSGFNLPRSVKWGAIIKQ